MNNLFTYGCSHTEGPFLDNGVNLYRKYWEFRGGNFPEQWNSLLASKLGYKLLNFGHGGTGNEQIYQSFLGTFDHIQEGDLVIYQIGQQIRVPFVYNDHFITAMAGVTSERWPSDFEIDYTTATKIMINKDNPVWIKNWLYNHIKSVSYIVKSKKAIVYFWFDDTKVVKEVSNITKFRGLLKNRVINGYTSLLGTVVGTLPLNSRTIKQETKGKVNDVHFGEDGHKLMADICYDFIRNNPQ